MNIPRIVGRVIGAGFGIEGYRGAGGLGIRVVVGIVALRRPFGAMVVFGRVCKEHHIILEDRRGGDGCEVQDGG